MQTLARKTPRRETGQGKGPRTIAGTLLDVRAASAFFGWSEKRTRAMVERQLLPFRKCGGRIVFVRRELEAYLTALAGCSVEQAIVNMAKRAGSG